jgi:predicted CoA-binding protein
LSEEQEILDKYRIIAIIGLSSDEGRASNRVGSYLKKQGYKIIPVNPTEKLVLEEISYPNLTAVPDKVEVVDIFRRSEQVLPIVEEAIKIGAKVIWMQEGINNEEAAKIARDAGLKVVMNKCIYKEHSRYHMR